MHGLAAGLAGRRDQGYAKLRKALALAPDEATRIFTTGYLGYLAFYAGNVAECVDYAELAFAACSTFPSPQFASVFGVYAAEAHLRMGGHEIAERQGSTALAQAEEAGFPFGVGLGQRILGKVQSYRGDHADGTERVRQALTILAACDAKFERRQTQEWLDTASGALSG
jgi:hypothetical protein